jgi:hypothetical protein
VGGGYWVWQFDSASVIRPPIFGVTEMDRENENIKKLLRVAKCPECDGSGVVEKVTAERTTWERSDGEMFYKTEPVQCYWCAGVEQALKD